MASFDRASTGILELDAILDGLRWGDNVVWQVADIRDYQDMVIPFVERAIAERSKVIYVRFAQHAPLLEPDQNVREYRLDANLGFEAFSSRVHAIVHAEGERACYVFDSLSDLLSAWVTDLMVGNFFRVACPFLFKMNTIAYFALIRDRNSYATIARIRETTQLLLDLFRDGEHSYVHPLKVWNRYSPTMFLPHVRQGDKFVPITSSTTTAQLFSRFQSLGPGNVERKLDYWDRVFLDARELLEEGDDSAENADRRAAMVDKLCRMVLGRDERMLSLARKYLTLADLVILRNRLVGSGFIGGKAVGMLLARKILESDRQVTWAGHLEPHDSFYIGSDVYCTYLVENNCWEMRQEQKQPENYYALAGPLQERIIDGFVPEVIRDQFREMLDYFGQSPVIVRSSSLLEDGFGNAFAGKYKSLFCVNQGSPQDRYVNFENAVKSIYASTMNEDALAYRLRRGMADSDEQMALLVQRVSGSLRSNYFFPDLAGVGFSYNPYPWHEDMDPQAGMVRLVLGLGTRAVNRVDDDYPRIVALDKPSLRPESNRDDMGRYSQHKVDVLDAVKNDWVTTDLSLVARQKAHLPWWKIVATPDYATIDLFVSTGREAPDAWILTFEEFLKGEFPPLMRTMLRTLEHAYSYPVDTEFTVNFDPDGKMRINLLQCRPLQTGSSDGDRALALDDHKQDVLFSTRRTSMGGNLRQRLDRLVYVHSTAYKDLTLTEKYQVARLIGHLNRMLGERDQHPSVLMGPGRWGSTNPSLGVPVSFAEICNFAVLVEVARREDGFMPELSFGTHFFQDLVETEIFYVALFPGRKNVVFNPQHLDELENEFATYLPDHAEWQTVIRVFDLSKTGRELWLEADARTQETTCFFRPFEERDTEGRQSQLSAAP